MRTLTLVLFLASLSCGGRLAITDPGCKARYEDCLDRCEMICQAGSQSNHPEREHLPAPLRDSGDDHVSIDFECPRCADECNDDAKACDRNRGTR